MYRLSTYLGHQERILTLDTPRLHGSRPTSNTEATKRLRGRREPQKTASSEPAAYLKRRTPDEAPTTTGPGLEQLHPPRGKLETPSRPGPRGRDKYRNKGPSAVW